MHAFIIVAFIINMHAVLWPQVMKDTIPDILVVFDRLLWELQT